MPRQLDILALEPFYGGARKAMLETIIRYSRHRWTVLRLPPRRMDRRLSVAAHWFAQQLSQHFTGRMDALFTSEAMNLADLMRQYEPLSQKPRVVYFHDNQLPAPGERAESPSHLVNLTTAAVASEIWFNSTWHLKTFLAKAAALVKQHPEFAGRNPVPQMTAKAHLVPPPVDLPLDRDILQQLKPDRDKRLVFVDTRDANVKLLNEAFEELLKTGQACRLITIGPLAGLEVGLPRITISEADEDAQQLALHQAAILVSARPDAPADHYAIRAMHLGCWPIFPDSGGYPELLPQSLHSACLYESSSPQRLAAQLHAALTQDRPADFQRQIQPILRVFDPLHGCQVIDERLEKLAKPHYTV